MQILVIADRPAKTSIKSIIDLNQIDLICTLGDLTYFDLLQLEQINNIPKIGVYGNHCSGNYFQSLGIRNVHLRILEYKGLIFGGFEGSLRYKESPDAKMYTQEEATRLLANFPRVDIMLAHSPAYGINDDTQDPVHTGLLGLRKYIEEQKPKYFFHGHSYPEEERLVTKWGDTKIVYVFEEKIINIPDEKT